MPGQSTIMRLMGALIAAVALAATQARAADTVQLRVNAFPNAKALPLQAGIATGIFQRRGFDIELTLTDNSRNQRDGLAAGKFDIVHAAVDNARAAMNTLSTYAWLRHGNGALARSQPSTVPGPML